MNIFPIHPIKKMKEEWFLNIREYLILHKEYFDAFVMWDYLPLTILSILELNNDVQTYTLFLNESLITTNLKHTETFD